MPRKVIREVDDQIDYQGELPAKKVPTSGAGQNAGGGCPDGKIFNSTTRKCVDSDTGKADTRSVPEPVARASSKTGGEAESETVDGVQVDDVAGSELPDDNEDSKEPTPAGGATLDAGDDEATDATVTSEGPVETTSTGGEAEEDEEDKEEKNGDVASEAKRNRLYHAKVKKAESTASRALEAQKARINAKKLRAQELKIDAEILRARESAKPQLNVMPAKGSFANGKVSAVEAEVSKPSAWLRAVQRHQNVSPAYVWSINKEKIFENYAKKGIRSFDVNDNEIITQIPKVKAGEASLVTIAGPAPADFMRIMSEQVLVLPNGKVVTPIRQFCETKILPPGTKEAFFFDFGDVQFDAIDEGNVDIATATPISSPIIRSQATETNPRGTRITIGYQQTEESPIDIIASANRAFALESINDESKQVLQIAYDTDSGSAGDAATRKAIGGGTKAGKWVNGNTGVQITADASGLGVMKYQGLLNAKGVIQDEGLDDSNLITYTSGKAIRDLTLDADLDSYIGFSRPAIITEATVERIAGTNLVRSSANAAADQGGTSIRSAMFIPNVAFGLVSGRDLTMEAQRRNELQAIHVTGTQKIAGVVKNVEATCRLSHL